MSNFNKVITNIPVPLNETEISNLSQTLSGIVQGGGGGGEGKRYNGDGVYVTVNNDVNPGIISLTETSLNKLNRPIPSAVSDLSDATDYATKNFVAETYQTVAGMDEYLTTANAQTLYQTKDNMSAYLTSANAKTLYQTKDDMSAYLTSANASSTYQTIAGMDEYATKDWTNNNFISEQELAGSVISIVDNDFARKNYVDGELNKKEDKLTFAYDNDKISAINGSALAGQGGKTYSAGAGIAIIDEYISLSADYIQAITQVSGKEDKLEFTYDNSGSIIKINNSAIAGGAGGGSVSYTGRNGVEINGNYIELETAAKNAIDSVAGISTDVGTLKNASANWNEVSAKLDSSLASATYQTKTDMANYLTTSDAASTYQKIGNYATKSDINDMATQTWVGQQGFYTKASGDNDYAPKSVTSTINTLTGASAGWNEVSAKLETAQYATDSATFLKQNDLDDYYQKTETSSKDQLTTEFAKYVTSSNVTTPSTDYVMTTTGWKVLTLPGGGMTQVIHDDTLTGQGNADNSKLGVVWSSLSGNTIDSAKSAGSAASAYIAQYYYKSGFSPINIATAIDKIDNVNTQLFDDLYSTPSWLPRETPIYADYALSAYINENTISSFSDYSNAINAKLDSTAAAQTYLTTTTYATDSATFVTSSSNTITGTKQYALTTAGWAEVQAGTSFTGVDTGVGLSGTGLSNSPLGIDTNAAINFTNGSAKSAVSAENAESARYTKQLKNASKSIEVNDITALQNWASSNSSTWDGVTAKLGTAQYANDSATFVTSSNVSISAAGEQYALTTTGWAKVQGGGGSTVTIDTTNNEIKDGTSAVSAMSYVVNPNNAYWKPQRSCVCTEAEISTMAGYANGQGMLFFVVSGHNQ